MKKTTLSRIIFAIFGVFLGTLFVGLYNEVWIFLSAATLLAQAAILLTIVLIVVSRKNAFAILYSTFSVTILTGLHVMGDNDLFAGAMKLLGLIVIIMGAWFLRKRMQ